MTTTLDVSGDWSVIDNYESVSYYVKTAEGVYADPPTTVAYCLRFEATKEQLEDVGASLRNVGMMWTIYKAKVTPIVPKDGDVIQDTASVRWSVRKVEVVTWQTRYRITTVKELTSTT